MATNNNILLKCLSKSLKTEIKSISVCRVKFFDLSGNDKKYIKEKFNFVKQIICLGVEKFYVLQGNLNMLIEIFNYEDIDGLEIDNKNPECFTIWFKTSGPFSKNKIKRIVVLAKYRGVFIKDIMCYYSIYYLIKHNYVKELNLALNKSEEGLSNSDINGNILFKSSENKDNNNNNNPLKNSLSSPIKKGLSRIYKQINHRDYEYFIKYKILENYNNVYFRISYAEFDKIDKKKASLCQLNTVVKGNNIKDSNINKEFEIELDIGDLESISKIDLNLNLKQIAFYSYEYVISYIKNFYKASKFWIISNKIFYKKMNLNEDKCVWECWKIEIRVSEPSYINLAFIILKRKFIPPFYNTYKCFHFILKERYSTDNINLSLKANEALELAANSISYSSKMNEKDYHIFLMLQLESLLLNEENLLFFQNNLKLISPDVYQYGYIIIYSLLLLIENYLPNSKEKSNITSIKAIIENKIKLYNNSDYEIKDHISLSLINHSKLNLKLLLNNFINLYDQKEINKRYKILKEKLLELDDKKETSTKTTDNLFDKDLIEDNSYILVEKETLNESVNETDKEKIFQKSKIKEDINKVLYFKYFNLEKWRTKCYRFVFYCINGCLTDYCFNFESLIEYSYRIQNTNIVNEINEFIFCLLNLRDSSLDLMNENYRKVHIPSLTERSNFTFNYELMCICIKKGWLTKYLDNSHKHYINFLILLLKKHQSILLLDSIKIYLKSLNSLLVSNTSDSSLIEERNSYNKLITIIINIYSDKRNSPIILTIAAKCLCFLINKDEDKINRLILIKEEIIHPIVYNLENYYYEDKLIRISLEILKNILPELKNKITDYLDSNINFPSEEENNDKNSYNLSTCSNNLLINSNNTIHNSNNILTSNTNYSINLLKHFKIILKGTHTPGIYYSQTIIAEVIQVLLSMTNIIYVGLKDRLNNLQDIKIYDYLFNYIDDKKKLQYIDPKEEISFVLEYRIFYLLSILIHKNSVLQEYLLNNLSFVSVIESKAENYKQVIGNTTSCIKSNSGYSHSKIKLINTTIKKFAETVYFCINKDEDRIRYFKKNCYKFNDFIHCVISNKNTLQMGNEPDVFSWINKLYKEINNSDY